MLKKELVCAELEELSRVWSSWSANKNFYLYELTPKLMKMVIKGDVDVPPLPAGKIYKRVEEVELKIFCNLYKILDDDEWKLLPDIILEFKEKRLREFECDRIELLKRKKIEESRLASEREARLKRKQFELAVQKLHEQFGINYLNAELFWRDQLFSMIDEDEYFHQRSIFVQKWVKKHLDRDVDLQQAEAAGHTEGHALVTARAGSGKTTTIVSRAVFLQKHCGVSPDQILLLVFNKSAAQEIEDRLKYYLGDSIPYVMTFHALAYAIIHPEESLLYDSPDQGMALSRSIQSIIDDKIKSPECYDRIRAIMISHFKNDWERIVSGRYDQEMDDLIRYRKSLVSESLRGEFVKSYGEKMIADVLFENSVTYKYERNHHWDGINYRPDFTIFKTEKSGVIIEYFGMAGESHYDEDSEAKRKYWSSKKNWDLLEISRSDVAKGEEFICRKILGFLDDREISHVKLTDEEIWNYIKIRALDNFTKTVVGFIRLCKQSLIDPDSLDKKILSYDCCHESEYQFLTLTSNIYRDYLDKLNASGEEDFDGLMARAANEIKKGLTTFKRKSGQGDLNNIKYLSIDEFQDFSELFWRMLRSILKINNHTNVFSVGDDWQAINRFAGSDLRFFQFYEEYFDSPKAYQISTNYRSEKKVVEVGNALMKSRGVESNANSKEKGNVVLVDLSEFEPTLIEKQQHSGDVITPVTLRIIDKIFKHGEKTILLSRRNSGLPWYFSKVEGIGRSSNVIERFLKNLQTFLPEEKKESVNISTAHKFKGLERTNVIILDAVEGTYPLIHGSWIFSKILGENLGKIIDDHRRLLYVALTRAVKNVFVISDKSKRSPFLDDIEESMFFNTIHWDSYPACAGESERIVVKIMNQGRSSNPTYKIKDLLKGLNYKYTKKDWNGWQKTFMKKGFNVNLLKDELWSKSADSIEVYVEDGNENILGHYLVRNGSWIESVRY